MKTWRTLGYLGLLPFLGALSASFLVQEWRLKGLQVFISYSAIILSFLAGSLWQVNTKESSVKRQIISNMFCLIAFLALLVETSLSLVILAVGYLWLFYYEKFLSNTHDLNHYLKMRFHLTVAVVLLHAVALYFWTML